MIFWIILFCLVVFSSFILAFQSLKKIPQYKAPTPTDYGVFLIRQKAQLNSEFLQNLYNVLFFEETVSIEKLFKGSSYALVLYASKQTAFKLGNVVDLLELEDFTAVDPAKVSVCRLSLKTGFKSQDIPALFKISPVLEKDEQLWIQLVLKKIYKKEHQKKVETSFDIALKKQLSKDAQLNGFAVSLRTALLMADVRKRESYLAGSLVLEELENYKKRNLLSEQYMTLQEILTLIS